MPKQCAEAGVGRDMAVITKTSEGMVVRCSGGDSKCHKDIDAGRSMALPLFTPKRRAQSTLAVAIDKGSAWNAMREGAIAGAAETTDAGVRVNPG
jgi:hypothetical protein